MSEPRPRGVGEEQPTNDGHCSDDNRKMNQDMAKEKENSIPDSGNDPAFREPEPSNTLPFLPPNFLRNDFQTKLTAIKSQQTAINAPLLPIHELLITDFLRPRDPTNPNTISTGVLTGGKRLWAFTVNERRAKGDLYYFVYDTRTTDRWSDGTRVIEMLDLVLVKAQIGVEGYEPELSGLLRSATRVFGGYTRFTSGMIHTVASEMVEYMGCLHLKSPLISPTTKYVTFLLDLICEHRLTPPIDLSAGYTDATMVNAGLPGRLIDYYPQIEFTTPRISQCGVYTKTISTEGVLQEDSAESGGDDKYLKKALEIHSMDNYDKQLQNEGLLSGWAADICRSEATQDLWRRATENR